MPGGAAAIKEPWRMGVSYLYNTFGKGLYGLNLPMFKSVVRQKIQLTVEMISKDVNCPGTSSLGRLFDGISAIVGIKDRVGFEGQAAMALEMLASEKSEQIYDYQWVSEDIYRILPEPIIHGVIQDMKNGVCPAVISSKFHETLIRMFSELCMVIRNERGLNRVALSGGVFQNSYLLTGLIDTLKKMSFKVYTHTCVPANDGGIALGQAVAAAAVSGK
jgi:hydrogenase maturation protein HypF